MFTGLQQALRWSDHTLESLHASCTHYAGRNRLSEPLTYSYTVCSDRKLTLKGTHSYFQVAKTDSRNLYKTETCFALVKTDSLNFNRPPTRFVVVKTEPPHAYYTLCGGENAPSTTLQVSYTIFGDQNAYSEPLQACYAHCDGQNAPSEFSQPLQLVKKLSPRLYRHRTCFAVIKTRLYKFATYLSTVKTLSEPLQASYTLCSGLNAHSEPLQVY